MRLRMYLPVAGLLAVALLASCGDDDDAADTPTPAETSAPGTPTAVPTSPPVETPDATTSPGGFEGSTDPVEVEAPAGIGQPILVNVRAAAQQGFDRLVFEFNGDKLPGYSVKYASEAIACASGQDLTSFVGDGSVPKGLILVTVRPAAAHDESGQATAVRDLRPALSSLLHVFRTCDFEGVVTYAVALSAEVPFKVSTLPGPPRLVIDFAQ
ncbi:MAG: hypothetical protein AB7J35_16900 [Dehalococcoidia bacterium]